MSQDHEQRAAARAGDERRLARLRCRAEGHQRGRLFFDGDATGPTNPTINAICLTGPATTTLEATSYVNRGADVGVRSFFVEPNRRALALPCCARCGEPDPPGCTCEFCGEASPTIGGLLRLAAGVATTLAALHVIGEHVPSLRSTLLRSLTPPKHAHGALFASRCVTKSAPDSQESGTASRVQPL